MHPRTRRSPVRAALFGAALTAAALVAGGVQAAGDAEDKRVNQEVLDILLEKGDIDQQRYDELKAREEAEHRAAEQSKVDIVYSNGLKISGENWKVQLGGRIQADFATIHVSKKLRNAFDDESDPLDAEALKGGGEGVEFRRLRLYMSGDLYDRIVYKAQLDFAGSEVAVKDAYIGMTGLGVFGTVKVGHMKEPFSLGELTSSKYITFMERALPSVFDSERNFGIGFENSYFDKRMTAAAGIFAPSNDQGKFFSNDTDFNVTARVTGLPVYDKDDGSLLHLGFSFSQRIQDDITNSFEQRPEVHLAKKYLFTGDYVSGGATIIGPELALVCGPWHASGEWTQIWVDREDGKDWSGMGAYIQSGFFLTGETRPYNTSDGTFARVKPKDSFDPTNGKWGAWEVAARFSFLDLNDSGMKGGNEHNVTAGLNWYLYSNLRMMFNYVWADVNDSGVSPAFGTRAGGDVNTFMMRAALEF